MLVYMCSSLVHNACKFLHPFQSKNDQEWFDKEPNLRKRTPRAARSVQRRKWREVGTSGVSGAGSARWTRMTGDRTPTCAGSLGQWQCCSFWWQVNNTISAKRDRPLLFRIMDCLMLWIKNTVPLMRLRRWLCDIFHYIDEASIGLSIFLENL